MSTSRPDQVALSWFGQTLWRFAPLYVELIFLAVCLRLIGLVEPFVFQVIIDRVLPFERQSSLIVVLGVFAVVSVFQVVFGVIESLLGILTANRVTAELGARLFDHALRLPVRHFRRWSIGQNLTRLSETDTIRNFLVGTTTGVALDLVFVVIYLFVLVSISTTLTTIVVIALPMQLLIFFALGPWLRHRLRAQFDAGARHQSRLVESLGGIETLKSLGVERAVLEQLDLTLRDTLQQGFRVRVISIVSDQLLFVVEQSVKIGVLFVGAQLVFAGDITLGQLIAFHLIAEKISGPIEDFAGLWESWQNIGVSRQRLADILNTPAEVEGELPALSAEAPDTLAFRSVCFGYDEDRVIIKGLELELAARSLTLVVGPSGVGKSTFGRLAAGLERPDSGVVLLGGQDIAELDPASVRARVVYLPQESTLFGGTLRENLSLGVPEASDAALRAVLKMAAADELLTELPAGLDTTIGDGGGGLSGGQCQRVAIARALLRRPRILVLDEPTSALDENSQKRIARTLCALRRTVSIVVITHRPALFTDPDLVMDFGTLA